MDFEKTIFSSRNKLKEVKDIFLEFVSVANEINALYDSNSLCVGKIFDPNAIIELRGGVPRDCDITELSESNPTIIVAAATSVINNGYSSVTRDCDVKKLSESNSTITVGAACSTSTNDCSNENVTRDCDVKKLSKSNSTITVGAACSTSTNDCSNENMVMAIEVPNGYGFNENNLEWVLNEEASSKNLVNYFYYLYDDDYDVHDTFAYKMDSATCVDIDVGIAESTSLLTQQNHAPHVESEFTSNVDGVEVFGFGLTDEQTLMDVDDVNVTTESISTSSNVNVMNQIVETSIIQQEFDNSNTFDYGLGFEVDCENDFVECETAEVKRYRGCDNSKMFVPTSDAGPKRYCCMYCDVRPQKLERHLRNVHKNEENVKSYLAFRPRSANRRKIIARIRKRGEFAWNNNRDLNGGEYAVSRRPNKKFQRKPWDLIPCPECQGGYTNLSRHWKECSKNPVKGERVVQQLGRAVEARLHSDSSQDLVDIFATFNENEKIRDIRFDWLAICYGNDLCLNHSPHYQQVYICGKLRATAKVLNVSKSISKEITDLSSLFHVKHCNTVIEAIYIMGKFDRKTKRFGSPGTASTTVTLINTVGELLLIETMKLDDPEKERDVERFSKVFKKDVRNKINKLVAVTKRENRRNKTDNIPTTADVNKLTKYLDSEREACFGQLVQEYSYGVWLKLAQVIMVSVLIYNRRRAGEMQNLLIKDFEKRDIVADQCDMILGTIPDEAKKKIKSRMTVRNKLGIRSVPVLLKHSWDDCLKLLVRHREDAGIPGSNEYLFALPTQTGKIRTPNVCAIIRSFSKACGAENHSSLRGTNLRKHFASFCATKNLSDNDISNLADFMGHAEAVHRAYYRMNPLANQVAKMSFLLDSAQGNDSEDGSEDGSEDDSDEYESDSQSETVISLNATRKTAKKNVTKGTIKKQRTSVPTKKKRNVKPKGTTQARKKSVTTTKIKKKRNVVPKETSKKKRKIK